MDIETEFETVNQAPASPRKEREGRVRKLTLAAMLTTVVIVLQLLGSAIHIGVFSINLALVPIVVGAALLGAPIGAWLGFVNAVVILLSGDAAAFLTVNVAGTIITVLMKGVLCGLISGLVYTLFARWNKYAAVILAALICPVVNTGIFLVGCRLFFWETLQVWGAEYETTWSFVLLGLIGANFLLELAVNVILAPAIARILGLSQDKNTSRIVYGSLLAIVGFGFLVFSLVLLGTQGSGNLFEKYQIGQGLNLTQRYVLIAVLSDICRIVGLFLIGIGFAGRRKSKHAENL